MTRFTSVDVAESERQGKLPFELQADNPRVLDRFAAAQPFERLDGRERWNRRRMLPRRQRLPGARTTSVSGVFIGINSFSRIRIGHESFASRFDFLSIAAGISAEGPRKNGTGFFDEHLVSALITRGEVDQNKFVDTGTRANSAAWVAVMCRCFSAWARWAFA